MVGVILTGTHCILLLQVINPRRRACAARVTVVVLCVCLSVTTFSATTRNKQAKKRHQRVQRYAGFILKLAIFLKVPRSKVMALKPSEQANMQISTGCPSISGIAQAQFAGGLHFSAFH